MINESQMIKEIQMTKDIQMTDEIRMIDQISLKMISYFGTDARRIQHTLKVHELAGLIGRREGLAGEDLFILEAAALLHDIGIKESERKYDSSAGKYQEQEGPPVAAALLDKFRKSGLNESGFNESGLSKSGLKEKSIERICYLIGHHHTYTEIDGLDFRALVEADFLVNIYEEGSSGSAVISIRDKYFKTETGIALLDSMFEK